MAKKGNRVQVMNIKLQDFLAQAVILPKKIKRIPLNVWN
jgi:hypothetical protein